MSAVLIDYGSGNLHSAAKALERAAREVGTETRIEVTCDPKRVAAADRIVLPGVGAFGDCRDGISNVPDLWETIADVAGAKARPFLGICVGMQLMATRGLEFGVHAGFGWIEGDVAPIEPGDPSLKIPHMGWNHLDNLATHHPVLAGLTGNSAYAYFVHSYGLVPHNPAECLATVNYGGPITAVVGRDNLVGTQFHPEKSQALGLRLLGNFLTWRP